MKIAYKTYNKKRRDRYEHLLKIESISYKLDFAGSRPGKYFFWVEDSDYNAARKIVDAHISELVAIGGPGIQFLIGLSIAITVAIVAFIVSTGNLDR